MSYTVINTKDYLTEESMAHMRNHGCDIKYHPFERMREDEICSAIQGADAVIAGGEYYKEKVFEAAEKLKIVARVGVGVDHVDLGSASKHGVWVTNTPGATSYGVADFTIGLMLCLVRNIPRVAQDLKNGKWNQFCGREFSSLTLGIIGTGSIGREVIKRASGFGSKILAYDIAPDDNFSAKWKVKYVTMDELMAQSDIVSIHCPLNEQTKGVIDERRLKLMKNDAYLVNTSRDQLVDKKALVAMLKAKKITGAAIDVHDTVPCSPGDPLVAMDNVIATPWTAFNTEEAISRMCITAASEVVTVLQGLTPRYPVNQI